MEYNKNDLASIAQKLSVKIGEEQQIRKSAIEAIDSVSSIIEEIPEDLILVAKQHGISLDSLQNTDFVKMKDSPEILKEFQENLLECINTVIDLVKPYLD